MLVIENLHQLDTALEAGVHIYVWVGTYARWNLTTTKSVYTFRITEEGARLLLRYRWRKDRTLGGILADWLDENRSDCLSSCDMTDANDRFSLLVNRLRVYCLTGEDRYDLA